MTIGTQIREARLLQGLTQQKLAELTGLSYVTINKIELGKERPRIDTLMKIINVLKIKLEMSK